MAKKYTQDEVKRLRQLEQERKQWLWRVRRLAALKLQWFRICTKPGMRPAAKGTTLHCLEMDMRQIKAELWRATPRASRMIGDGKHKDWAHPDSDRHHAIVRLEREASDLFNTMLLVQRQRRRVRRGLPPVEPPIELEAPTHDYGTIDVDLDDMVLLGRMNTPRFVSYTEARIKMESYNKRHGFKPSEVPQAQPASPGRPSLPTPVEQTVQGALDVRIPFGKYRDFTLSDLLEDDDGLSYLYWLANDASIDSNRFHDAVQVLYEAHEEQCQEARKRSWRRR